MLSVDIGIGHDDDLVVAELVDVCFLGIHFLLTFLLYAEAYAEGLDDVVHFLAFESLVPHGLFDVEDFSAQGENGLCGTATALFGRTSGGVSLDEEEFRLFGHLALAVGKFSGKSASAHRAAALYGFACLAGGNACRGGKNHLVYNDACLAGVFLKVIAEGFTDGGIHNTHHFGVAKFGLGLSFELGLCHLDADDGGKTFAEVFTGDFHLCLLNLLGSGLLSIFLQHAGDGSAETCKVRTTLDGVDVVDVGMEVFAVAGVVDDGHFHGDAVTLGVDVDDIGDKGRAHGVLVTDKLAQAEFTVEYLLMGFPLLVLLAHVGQCDGESGIEECQFAHAVGEDAVAVCGGGEDFRVGPELLARAAQFGLADYLHGI